MRFYVVNSNVLNEYMRITAAGSVGIGTTGPQLKFVVSNGGASGLELDPTAVASSPLIQAYNRTGAAYMQLTFDALLFVWRPGGTERLRLDNSGYLWSSAPMVAWNATTPGTSRGSFHIGTASATSNAGGSITFGARDQNSGSDGQAGIYVNSDGTYGTRMYFATTNNYGTGSITAMTIDHVGIITANRDSFRAPVFYDSANSSFYVDPAGISALNEIRPAVIRYSDGTNAIALNNGTYTLFYDRSGRTAIYLGGSFDQNNYYDNIYTTKYDTYARY
jgi:hypothetical protein